MPIYSHMTSFEGLPIIDWVADETTFTPGKAAYRVRIGWGDTITWADRFAALLAQDGIETLSTLIIGTWDTDFQGEAAAREVVEQLVAARDQLPNLKALFFGDIIMEESEISWIEQTHLTPLLDAYPQLETFGVRGGNGLSLAGLKHEHLKKLIIETGGLSRRVVQQVIMAQLPNLEHLELWLGEDNYGGDATPEDLSPLLAGKTFPNLRYLGLRDSAIIDDLAAVLANAPIVERIDVLDLSLGNLSDVGAEALLKSSAVRALTKLDLHHHFCSDEMIERLEALPISVNVNDPQSSERWDGREWRFIAVSE